MIQKNEIGAMMRAVSEVVKEYVSASLVAVIARLDDFDARLKATPRGLQGEPGIAGKDADPELMRDAIHSAVRLRVIEELQSRESAVVDMVEISEAIRSEVKAAVSAIPPAKDGAHGEPGKDGADVDMAQVRAMVDHFVAESFELIPAPKDGERGERGESGTPGESIKGETGERGADGKDGTNGRDGKDADPELIRSLIGAESGVWSDKLRRALADQFEQRFAALPIPKDGKDGRDAKDVDPELVRTLVREEVETRVAALPTPKDGKDGRDGRDAVSAPGRDGEPGRDALELDILPSVDLTKSYPRGTFASYAGGMIRSIRRTDPVTTGLAESGWAVIVDGFCDPDIQQLEDLRTIAVTMKLTSGVLATRQFTMPVLIYRGIFKEGDEYTRGDVATWAGSTWHCQAEATKAKPGEGSPDWKLMVKRGSAGKDAVLPVPPTSGPVKL